MMNCKIRKNKNFVLAINLISALTSCTFKASENTTYANENHPEQTFFNVLREQDCLLNSLKGITALQVQYANLKQPSCVQILEKCAGLQDIQDIYVNSANLKETFDGAASVVTKKLEEYELSLLHLIKKIESDRSNSQNKIKGLPVTLEQRWSESNGALSFWGTELRRGLKEGGFPVFFFLAWPYIFVNTSKSAQKFRNFVVSLLMALPSSLLGGVGLNLLFNKLASNFYAPVPESTSYESEDVSKLHQQLKTIKGLEELLNAALVYQKNHALLTKHSLALSDQ